MALQSHNADDLDELEINTGDLLRVVETYSDDYWLMGQVTRGAQYGMQGLFPRHICTIHVAKAKVLERRPTNQNEHCVDIGTIVSVLYEYTPVKPDELQLVVGMDIEVLESPQGGWWRGICISNSSQGWFPNTLCRIEPIITQKIATPKPTIKRRQSEIGRKLTSVGEAGPILRDRAESDLTDDVLTSQGKLNRIDASGSPSSKNSRTRSESCPTGSLQTLTIDEAEKEPIQITNLSSVKEVLLGSNSQLWQMSLAPDKVASLTKEQRKSISAIWELVQTERDFVRDLNLIQEVFIIQIAFYKAHEFNETDGPKKHVVGLLQLGTDH
jgi:hypothetical protein